MWRSIYQEFEEKLQALADEFGRSLHDFINGLRLDRAHSWEALLHGFLHDWRQRGILVEEPQRQKLYKLLGELRAELVPAEDLRAAMDCWKRQAADALSRSGPLELGEPGSAEEAALPPGVRQLGQGIMRRHPPENWMHVVDDVSSSWRFAEGVAVQFKAWMTAERDAKSADANSNTQPNLKSALEDAATARLRSLGEVIMQQYPPERWLVEAQNRIQALPASEETKRQFLKWIEAEQYWRLLPKQVAQGAGQSPGSSASAALQAEFKAGFIEGFTDGMQQSAATVGYLAGLLVRVQIASNTFASLAYAAIFNGAPLEAELRLMSDVGMFGADLSKGSNWQTSMLMTMGSAAVLAQIEKAQQALATIKPVLDLVRSAVSDQDPRAQGKIVGWAAYQAVESALTAGAAELAKPGTLALVYRRLLASPAIRANEALEKALRAALEKITARRVPSIAAPSNLADDAVRGRLFAATREKATKFLGPGEGITDKWGNVRYSLLGSADEIALARHHEAVHSFLSPKFNFLREFRANLGAATYQKSALLRYTEEAIAETYAQLRVNGIKGTLTGTTFPVKNGYVTVSQLAKEGAIGTIVVGGVTYSIYAFLDD